MRYGILFDLDGTLLDTLEDLADGVNHTLDHFGYPRRTLEEVRQFVGNGARQLLIKAVPPHGDPEAAFLWFRDYYEAHCRIKTRPYAGILPALTEIAEKWPIAIVSNKPHVAVTPLCDHFFPGIYALGEQPGTPRKPAPDMLFKAMARLGVDRCIYVGDSEVDMLTAKNAGVPCISVLWGFRDRKTLEDAGGQYFCETAEDLISIIEEILHGQ